MMVRRDLLSAIGITAVLADMTIERFELTPERTSPNSSPPKSGLLPIQQVTRVELVLNRGIARQIGVTFPETMLLRADAVIE